MYNVSDSYLDAFKAPARQLYGEVRFNTSVGVINIAKNSSLINFTIEKTAPQGKLFGFAVSQKITVEAIGILNTIKKGDRMIPLIKSVDYDEEEVAMPYFYVETVEHNKVKNRTTIVGYDILHKLDSMPINDFEFTYPVYALNYALDILEPVGGYAQFEGINHLIREAPNLNGNESARSVLAYLAEFTGSICYVSQEDTVKFRGMAPGDFTDVLTADDYYDLTIGESVTLTQVASNTELGDNYAYGDDTGYVHIMWENPFMNMRSDVNDILVTTGNQVRNLASVGYNLTWRGCPAYELGDFVILQERDGTAQYAHYFNERMVYNGGLKVTSEWEPVTSQSAEVTPPSVGSTIKQTSAKVDKVNKRIDLLVTDVEENEQQLAQIQMTQNEIKLSVETQNQEIEGLNQRVSQAITSEQMEIAIEKALEDIDSSEVTTKTGFTFNADGLKVSKSNSEMTTLVTEDGLAVYRNGEVTLRANNEGVTAEDLHATTYLLIGSNSRFEDYNNGERTGCFWIGKGGEA